MFELRVTLFINIFIAYVYNDSLCGIGKGPVFCLNVITIDVDKIYMYSEYYYEVERSIWVNFVKPYRASNFNGSLTITPDNRSFR